MKVLMLAVFVVIFGAGCSLTEKREIPAPVVQANSLCESEMTTIEFGVFCDIDTWNIKLIEYSSLSWPTRNNMIKELGEQPVDLFQKVLLSHGNDTPYASRLRAQNWIGTLQTLTDKSMTQLLDILFFQANQQLLELESAITILSKVNARQAKEMEAQSVLLDEKNKKINVQEQQLEQLLNIEASLIEKERGDL